MSEKIIEMRFNTEKAADYFSNNVAYTLGPVELKETMEEGNIKVIDVRDESDYKISHIPGAISIPKSEIESKKEILNKDTLHVIYCYNQQCHLGAKACLELAELGYPVILLEGGFKTWTEDFHYAVSSPIE